MWPVSYFDNVHSELVPASLEAAHENALSQRADHSDRSSLGRTYKGRRRGIPRPASAGSSCLKLLAQPTGLACSDAARVKEFTLLRAGSAS